MILLIAILIIFCLFSIFWKKKNSKNKLLPFTETVKLKPFSTLFSFNQEKVFKIPKQLIIFIFNSIKVQPSVKNLKSKQFEQQEFETIEKSSVGSLEYEVNYNFSKEEVLIFTKIF